MSNSDQKAIETLLSLAEKYGSTTRHLSQQGAGAVQGTRGTDKISKMEKHLRVCCIKTQTFHQLLTRTAGFN
jgi:hypothetical protein